MMRCLKRWCGSYTTLLEHLQPTEKLMNTKSPSTGQKMEGLRERRAVLSIAIGTTMELQHHRQDFH